MGFPKLSGWQLPWSSPSQNPSSTPTPAPGPQLNDPEVTGEPEPEPEPPLPKVDRTAWLTKLRPTADAPTRRLQDQDRVEFKYFSLSNTFKRACTCDTCCPRLYFNWPLSCPIEHQKTDLVIMPNEGPRSSCPKRHTETKYEALHLAGSAIEYFSRDRQHMSEKQKKALAKFKKRKPRLFKQIGQEDCSDVPVEAVLDAMKLLNNIFFLGAISPHRQFTWDGKTLEEPEHANLFGWTRSKMEKEQMMHTIFINPVAVPPRMQTSLASARLGTLLHEMLHAFVSEWACKECYLAVDNAGSDFGGVHGRAWFRIAKALDEVAPRLLGCPEVDLGVFSEIQNWFSNVARRDALARWMPVPACMYLLSIHDLETYGVL